MGGFWKKLVFVPVVYAIGLLMISCSSRSDVGYKALDHYMGVWNGTEYEPLYIKGVNLGVGIPGTEPGELALDRETYLRWFAQMKQNGVNVVRIYTLHKPVFYESLFEFNNFRPHDPLYVIHGIWLDEDTPTGGIDIIDLTHSIDNMIVETIDAVHGNAEIGHRLGRGFGTYQSDISRWVMAWILGREMYASEVLVGNYKHQQYTSFTGDALTITNASPVEVWATERLDLAITHERKTYGSERPIALSNWPTLDPLSHITEPHFAEPGGSIDSLWDAGEDDATVDMSKVDTTNAPAGLFASYHIYPYYPNFIFREPRYQQSVDHLGPNNYIGYLKELKDHYGTMPLMVSEYGIPSSWGNAHTNHVSGLHHGGHDEQAQAEIVERLAQNVFDSGCAGGMIFSWMDEWWKRTWIVANRTFPVKRFPLWLDITSPEENYGLIAYDLPSPDFDQWNPVLATGHIREVRAAADAAYFHVRVSLETPLGDGEILTVGYDTYRDDLGESILPGGITTTNRNEFALVIRAPDQAHFQVTRAYDYYAVDQKQFSEHQKGKSTASDGHPWQDWRWIVTIRAISDDGNYIFPQNDYHLGNLRTRRQQQPPSSLDAVVLGQEVEIRIPWTMLHFSDPSTRSVLHDDLSTDLEIETVVSQGIRVSVALKGQVLETERFQWPTWDEAPETIERDKPAMESFRRSLNSVPDQPVYPR